MLLRGKSSFASVRTEGGLLPPDLLVRIANGDSKLAATAASDYHLGDGETKREAISRSWSRLASAWTAFQDALAKLPPNDPATTTTREKWLGLVFQELGFGRLEKRTAVDIEGKSYAISHGWRSVPIHLVGANVPIDRRSEHVVGASRTSPHGLVQEFLNRRDDALWGIVSNGKTLRLLRDSVRLSRPAYIEFDLAAIFEGGAFADFALFWLVCHQSRFEPFQSERIEDCALERWSKAADEEGTRVLDGLRDGVRAAIEDLGRGFLAHPSNTRLRDALRDGRLAPQAYYRQLLRAAYRLIFQAVAEDRGLLQDPNADAAARGRYTAWYSLSRVRRLAEKRRGSRHDDLWRMVKVVWRLLGDDRGGPALALPALGSFLWSDAAVPDIIGAELTNAAFLDAIHHLAFAIDGNTRRAVDFEHLGAEELGSVYESLLELHPELHLDDARFDLIAAAGNDRKSTGSYYTPDALVQCLLDSALEPVLEAIVRADDRRPLADRLLAVKVCDPACGSGHFLIAAAHRIAKRVAQARTGDDEPAPADHRQALRDVIGRCLFGVDKNEMAVELCKVSLWLESLTSGQPLSFLDDRILVGDALLGATPALLRQPLPAEAFDAIGDDDKALARNLKAKNRDETLKQKNVDEAAKAQAQLNFAVGAAGGVGYADLTREARNLDALDDRSIAGVRAKEAGYRRLHDSPEYLKARLAADAWCAAFVWPKKKTEPEGLTTGTIRGLVRGEAVLSSEQARTVERLRRQYAFFHWCVEFPQVFEVKEGGANASAAGWVGGFDCVLGNPPWERVKLQEQEFFASRSRAIAAAPNAAARRKLIEDLARGKDGLIEAYEDALRAADGASHLVRRSGRYPLCGRGDVNTYSIFAETMRAIVSARGRIGCIVPSGIATDDTTKFFFQDLMETGSLVSLFDFENREGLFPAVDSRMKFTLLTLTGVGAPTRVAEFAFFALRTGDLDDTDRRFTLTAQDLALLNPNTKTCPVFRSRRDAEITKAIYRRVPVLIEEGPPEKNPWGLTFARLFDMSNDSGLFKTKVELEGDGWKLDGNVFVKGGDRYLPLYEAKMIHHFDHRWATYDGLETRDLTDAEKADPACVALPRYWVPKAEVDKRLAGRWDREWLIGWRDICRSTDERTVIASVVPRVGVGDKFLLGLGSLDPAQAVCLVAMMQSLCFDFIARQKIGGTSLKYFTMRQIAALPPRAMQQLAAWMPGSTVMQWICGRVVELAYNAVDLREFARDLGHDGPPFEWNEERRFQLRCELDAAFFHLYGIARDDVDYILETFPIVKRNDEKRWGEYRTKRVILELFDAMAGAVPDKADAQAGNRVIGEHRNRPAKQSGDPAS